MMRSEAIAVELEGGRKIFVEANIQGEEQVSFGFAKFSGLSEAVGDIAKSIAGVIDQVKPASAEVEFGVDAAIESGQLTALLVKGTGTANVKITLRWDKA
jgi:hypothetical protein